MKKMFLLAAALALPGGLLFLAYYYRRQWSAKGSV